MPNRLRIQRRGKGKPKYRATKNTTCETKYVALDKENELLFGEIIDITADAGRTGVMVNVHFDNDFEENVIAAEGVFVGQKIEHGEKAELDLGNVLPLKAIAEGCPIFNIEKTPGDGGSLVKASGMYALITTKDQKSVYVKLPSTKIVALNPKCRATVGCAAGGARTEKPFVKAGKKYHAMKAKSRPYPRLRGVAMNPVDHPFGGSQHHAGKSKSTSRHAAPGRKVGAIASSRTGRRKR